jgi:hypothetical protein
MDRRDARQALESRAAEALRGLLRQVSVIDLKDIRLESQGCGREIGILAQIRVLGHSHTLVCKVKAGSELGQVRMALEELRNHASRCAGDATPVLIAPYLSPRAQALCIQSQAGFLDLEGNARLNLGEVFIGRRSLPIPLHHHSSASSARTADPSLLEGFPPARSGVPATIFSIAAGSEPR